MDMVLSFFKNKWTKLGFSLVSGGYVAFLIWVTWLSYSHFLRPTDPTSLFVFYTFINILFGVGMVYTRYQVLTRISAMLIHPICLVMLFLNYGNWYMIVPPVAVGLVCFFVARSGESLKIVLGTLYLILYVVVVIGVLVLDTFSIELFKIKVENRSDEFLYSPDHTYRVVKYIDPEDKENRTVQFYVESGNMDKELPFLVAERCRDGEILLTARFTRNPEVKWIDDERLLIDGAIKNIPMLLAQAEEEELFDGETAIFDVFKRDND